MRRIALAGNPNIGKTTIFNALTGANQKVGNWPGVTVHRKEGQFVFKNDIYTVVDLPGTYSLGSYSEDEQIATDYVLSHDAQLILNVVDATNLERNLYLTLQLLEMEVPVVLALNMMDEAEKYNIHIRVEELSDALGIPVIPIIASKHQGLDVLIETIADELNGTAKRPRRQRRRQCRHNEVAAVQPPCYPDTALPHLEELRTYLDDSGIQPSLWYALQILSGDLSPLENGNEPVPETIRALSEELKEDPDKYELDVIDARYRSIHAVVSEHVTEVQSVQEQKTDRIDRILMHPVWGIPIFAAVMFIVFQLTFAIGQDIFGEALDGWVSSFSEWVGATLSATQLHPLITGFITEGLIAGVGTVLTFIPLIVVLYLLIGFLEDIGYMARVAYVMDQFMRKIGLQGKAVVSMIVGFGCNVPGVMATRTLENQNDRMISMMINPFMSCGAKIPVYAMLTGVFFSEYGGLVTFGLYVLGFVVAIIVAKILSLTLFKGNAAEFIMELPPYRMPVLRNVVRNMADNVLSFLKRATTIITAVIAVIYLLSVLPYGVEPYSANSILGRIGSFIAPVLAPMGNGNWQAAVGLVAGMPAKEGVTAILSMIYSADASGSIQQAMAAGFTSLSALSFLVMVLLYTPCVAVLSTVKAETASTKWMLFMAFYTLIIAYIVSVLVYQIGALLGFS